MALNNQKTLSRASVYLPLFIVELYLIVTLFIFLFGPISYFVESPIEFFYFIVLYHLCSIFGYVAGVGRTRCKLCVFPVEFSHKLYYALIAFSFIAFLIGHKNITGGSSIIPYDIFDGILNGLQNSSEQYVTRNENQALYSGDKELNILYFFVAFSKIVLIPVVVFFWERLSFIERIIGLVASALPVFSGISTGTNSPIFQFVIFYGASLILYFSRNKISERKYRFKSRSFFVFSIAGLFLFALFFFGSAMLGRGGDPSYLETTSPLGHIAIAPAYKNSDGDSFISYLYVWLSNYLVQGYYGFSRALEVDFSTTFGFGNSQFVARQVQWITGVDVLAGTYQHKVNAVWDENAQWHSMYSHLANDFHFFGVALVMFVIFYNFARVWLSFVCLDNFYAKLLLPLFCLMFVFMPANNQVFGFLETLSSFLIFYVLWIRSLPQSFTRNFV